MTLSRQDCQELFTMWENVTHGLFWVKPPPLPTGRQESRLSGTVHSAVLSQYGVPTA